MTERPELLEMFREEVEERLDGMAAALLTLEQGNGGPEQVASLFRDAHSIKGSAGMMGLDEVYSIAHALEDVLAEARSSDPFPVNLIDPLLGATDALRRAAAAETGLPHPAPEPASFSGAAAERPAASTEPRQTPVRPEVGARRSMRVDATRVDHLLDAIGETVLHQRRLEHAIRNSGDHDGTGAAAEELDRGKGLLSDLRDAAIDLRTVPLSSITGSFPRAVRDLAAAEGKQVQLSLDGIETQLDRTILDGIGDTITHLLRNAVAHGIEAPDERTRAGKPSAGRIELHAEQRGDRVAITVVDDGRGVPAELVPPVDSKESLSDVLSQAGLSTADSVTAVSGRGVGLDAVKTHVESIGGTLTITSEPDLGTTATLLLPLSIALVRLLLVECAGSTFGIPLAAVGEVVPIIETLALGSRISLRVRDDSIPLTDIVSALGGHTAQASESATAVVLEVAGMRVALACDRVLDEDELITQPLGPLLAPVPGYLGAAVLGDGRIALIADPAFVVRRASAWSATPTPHFEHKATPMILVVDDQFTVRELQRSILEAAGYRVIVARHGREAQELLEHDGDVDCVVTDIEMPEMDGIELLVAIRNDPHRSTLPVVIVTSRAGGDAERLGLEAGADAYIVKQGFDQEALLATVGRLVGV